MDLRWERESPPLWDVPKQRIIGGASRGLFPALRMLSVGALLPGEWWRVDLDGRAVGYGWMDVTWGDAEVLLAVDSDEHRRGIGTFILDHLADEAARRGLRYLNNVIPAAYPDPAHLAAWLGMRGFAPSGQGGLLRRSVAPSENR